MKYMGKIAYLLACLMICVFPFAGMLAGTEYGTTENRELAKLPQLETEGKWNTYFLQELGAYFEDHFAFRPLLVAIDANIQSRVFQVSNVDTVTVGEDGWLYYTASMEDYLGKSPLSPRGISNAAHNLALMQQYVESRGAAFLFAAAPNKNSLYGEHMPNYLKQEGKITRQWDLLKPELEKYGVSYVDLFSLFEGQEEVLYLKRDSHWNQKGAMLAYRAMMEKLDLEHETYETVTSIREKKTYGDLSRMLYPLGSDKKWDGFSFLKAEPEWDYSYQKENAFQYLTDTESVEEAWIETKSQEGEKTLLMFRDSFGNTLLPFMANAFERGCFSRSVPFNLTGYMEGCKPDAVILEKVERDLEEFAKTPPLMEGLQMVKGIRAEGSDIGSQKTKVGENRAESGEIEVGGNRAESGDIEIGGNRAESGEIEVGESSAESGNMGTGKNNSKGILEMAESENNVDYWEISGVLPDSFCTEGARIYIRVKDGEEQADYAAFHVSIDVSDYGFCLYLRKESLQNDTIALEVLVETEDGVRTAQSVRVSLKGGGNPGKEEG